MPTVTAKVEAAREAKAEALDVGDVEAAKRSCDRGVIWVVVMRHLSV